jgi:hypothetical protein
MLVLELCDCKRGYRRKHLNIVAVNFFSFLPTSVALTQEFIKCVPSLKQMSIEMQVGKMSTIQML